MLLVTPAFQPFAAVPVQASAVLRMDNQGRELRDCPLFAPLANGELERVVRAAQVRRYGNGEVIFSEGNPSAGLYVLRSGRARLLTRARDKEHLLAIVSPGDSPDLVPLLDGGPHTCTLQARGALTLYFIPSPLACQLIWDIPPLLNAVINAVSSRLRDLCALATDLAFNDVTTRVCQVLFRLMQAEGEPQADGIHLKRTLSQSEIASLAGTSREVAWRALKKLEEAGLIGISPKEITLFEPERLAAMA